MRICMVTHYCKPHIGGIETISFEEAKRLARQGHHVTLVSSRTAGEPPEECLEGVRIRRVKAFNLLEQRLGVPYPFFDWVLVKQLNEEIAKADVCIVHGFAFQSSLAAAWICNRKHVPYVLIQHNTFVHYKNRLLNWVQRLNDLLVGRYTLQHAVHLFAVSEQTREYVHNLVNSKIEVLYNAVDETQFYPDGGIQMARQALGLPADKFIVITVRKLSFKYAIDTLLQVALSYRDDPRLYFVIVGSGPDRQAIEAFLRENRMSNCRLTGFVPHKDLPPYYRAANLFVLPSRTGEGFPIAVLEAMASGTPVLATKAGGQVEIIHDRLTGHLVDIDAPQEIVARIDESLADGYHMAEMKQQGRTLIFERFTWEAHIQKLMHAIEHCQNPSGQSISHEG